MAHQQQVVKRVEGFQNENTVWHHMQDDTMDEFDRRYDEAVAEARKNLGNTYKNIINGKETEGSDGTFEDTNPSNPSEVLGTFQKSSKEDVQDAVAAAGDAFDAWSHTPYQERAKIFRKASDLLRERKHTFAAWMSLENGKNRVESMNDVDEAIDFLDYYPRVLEANDGFARQMGKPFPNEDCVSVMKPYGVWGVIPPFNFPVAIAVGMTTGPTVVGNTAVLKPASDTPLVAYLFVKLLHDAGLPPGVVNFVTGPGSTTGNAITDHEDVAGVVFTGSKKVGLMTQEKLARRNRPFIAEMGGKNAIVVTENADLDKAVPGVGKSAFGLQGQKCSACSRVYVHKSIKDEFTKRLVEWTKETCTIGDPTKKENFMGPLINQSAYEDYRDYVLKAKADGGKILVGGSTAKEAGDGYFVEATLVDGLSDDAFVSCNELFVPITSIYVYKDLDEAIDRVNAVEYGLTSGIFTENEAEIDRYFDRTEAGVLYANRASGGSTAAVVGGQSFVGWKNSGSSGRGAGGDYYILQFLREQSQTRVS